MKYGNRKVIVDGIKFDSKKEALRWRELSQLQRAGKITDLRRQVKFELLPSQKLFGKVIERPVTYVADFTYIRVRDNQFIVEDVKGYKKGQAYALFALKRKMMLYFHGIVIQEV